MQTFHMSQQWEDHEPAKADAIFTARETVRTSKAIDFLAQRLRAEDFEEISPANGAGRRVFRSNRSGISIYFGAEDHNPRLLRKSELCGYTVAYEGEVQDSTQVQQIILQCTESDTILKFLDLVESNTRRIRERLEQAHLRVLEPRRVVNIAQLGRFHQSGTRIRILKRMAVLCPKRLTPASYDGFVNAVTSNIEYWLSDNSIARKERPA